MESFYPSPFILKSESSRENNNCERSGHNPHGPGLPMFHMGGDEANFDCMAKDQNIIDRKEKNGYSSAPQENQEGYVKLCALF